MDFRNAPTMLVQMHKSFSDRARVMSRERSRGQPGTIESGSSHGNGTLQVRTTASLANTSEAYARVSSQALKSGWSWRVIPSSVRKGFAQEEEEVERHWMALQSQLLRDLERGVQWIAGALRQGNPDGLPINLE